MPAAPQDFHYMTVLRELEKSVTALHPKKPKVADSQLADLVGDLYGRIVQELTLKLANADSRISLQLGAEQERQVEAETKIIKHIEQLTDDHYQTPELRRQTGNWPPLVPVARMVERFTALTIGFHAEHPKDDLAALVVSAFREAILPGLAWGLMVRLYAQEKSQRRPLQDALGQRLRKADTNGDRILVEQVQVRLDYLTLVDAWFHLLGKKALGEVTPETIQELRVELAVLIEKDLGELDTELWERLGQQYLGSIDGSERAFVIARAQKHGVNTSVFFRQRLSLFEAARQRGIQAFRHQVETEPLKAVQRIFAAEIAKSAQTEAGAEACGGAFWLARATFGRHQDKPRLLREEASTKAVLLLVRASVMFKHQAAESHQLITSLRYAAGFATNPRYVRSLTVLHFHEALVDLYAEHPLHRQALVELFRGRIAWQRWYATDSAADRKQAIRHYHEALKLRSAGRHGFDAEAPIHFFPELTVLLRQVDRRQEKELKTLKAVDFITQRNYGIYFDIDDETKLIEGGLEAYQGYLQVRQKAEGAASPLAEATQEARESLADFEAAQNSAEARRIAEDIGIIRRAIGFNR